MPSYFSFFFSSRRRHTRSVSAFLLNRSSDLNALRDYFRDIGRMVLAAEGRKANDSHADCYQYFCVPEYVQLMAVFISMRCTLCGHFLQVALTLILVVGYAIAAS